MKKAEWKIGREGRAWEAVEATERHNLLPEPTKIEMHNGKLFWNDDDRLVVALLRESSIPCLSLCS